MATTAGTHAGPQGGLAPAAGSGEETQSPGGSAAPSRSPATPSPPPNLAASRRSTPPQSRPPQQPRQTLKLLQRESRRGAGVAWQGHPLASGSPPYAAAGRHPPLAPAPPPAVAVQQIQPSVLNVSIGDCSFVPAEILGGAAVHWRQRAPFKSRARDRQSSYNPQLCIVRGAPTRNVVRRSLGDHSSTRARTRGACSPASPGKDTAIFSEICGIILTTLPSRHPTRPAAAILGRECNICAALAIPTRVLRSPQARIAVAHQHASSGRRAARPALRDRRRSPRAGPLRDRRRGPEGADSAPQGRRGRF